MKQLNYMHSTGGFYLSLSFSHLLSLSLYLPPSLPCFCRFQLFVLLFASLTPTSFICISRPPHNLPPFPFISLCFLNPSILLSDFLHFSSFIGCCHLHVFPSLIQFLLHLYSSLTIPIPLVEFHLSFILYFLPSPPPQLTFTYPSRSSPSLCLPLSLSLAPMHTGWRALRRRSRHILQ